MANKNEKITIADFNNLLSRVNEARQKHDLAAVNISNPSKAKASDLNQITDWLKEAFDSITGTKPDITFNYVAVGQIITASHFNDIYDKATQIFNTENAYPGKLLSTYNINFTLPGQSAQYLSALDKNKIVISGTGYRAGMSGFVNKPTNLQIIDENLNLLYYDAFYSEENLHWYTSHADSCIYRTYSGGNITVLDYANNNVTFRKYCNLNSGRFSSACMAVINNVAHFYIYSTFNYDYISLVKNGEFVVNSRQLPEDIIFSLPNDSLTDDNQIIAVSKYGTSFDLNCNVLSKHLTTLDYNYDLVGFYGYKNGWLVKNQIRLNTTSHYPSAKLLIQKNGKEFFFSHDYINRYHLGEDYIIYTCSKYSSIHEGLYYYKLNADGSKTTILEISDQYLKDFLVLNGYLYVLYCNRNDREIPTGRVDKYKL